MNTQWRGTRKPKANRKVKGDNSAIVHSRWGHRAVYLQKYTWNDMTSLVPGQSHGSIQLTVAPIIITIDTVVLIIMIGLLHLHVRVVNWEGSRVKGCKSKP